MQAFYGGYAHDANEVFVKSWNQQGIVTPRGFVRSILVTAVIGGFKKGTAAQMTAAINAMVAAYSVGNKDFAILDNNGQSTYFALPVTGSIGGVRVAQRPSFQMVDQAQYVTRLDYELTLEAEYPAVEDNIIDFHETLSFRGGIPILIVRPCINQIPVEQQVSPQSPYEANQSGVLVTATPNPNPLPPIWPAYLVDVNVVYSNEDRVRGAFISQAVQWNYSFASANQLTGRPTNL